MHAVDRKEDKFGPNVRGIKMSERALPYYKWFWQDWRSNRAVQRMSYVERGLYRELLDECWVEGCIPDDLVALAEICGCPVDVMASAWQVLSKCFVLLGDGWHNEKLDSLRTERDDMRIKRAAAGRAGGLAKSLKEKEPVASAKQTLANASKCHIEEAEAEAEAEKEAEGEFVRAWAEYPKRAGGNSRADALKHWRARTKEGVSPETLIAGVIRYRKYCEHQKIIGQSFVMQASRFFGTGKHYDEPWKFNPYRAPAPPVNNGLSTGWDNNNLMGFNDGSDLLSDE